MIREFQTLIEQIYLDKDRRRGVDGTFRWLTEEVGELARGIRHKDLAELSGEFADVFAWLASLASQCGISLEAAALDKYRDGCPKCHAIPCNCVEVNATSSSPSPHPNPLLRKERGKGRIGEGNGEDESTTDDSRRVQDTR
jgi:NTP pyrophosphatase (non-canonical NTP hydrolase)